MADLLIKGMKMPKTCMNGGCPIDGKYCQLWWKAGGGEYGRHPDCPLVPVVRCKDCKHREAETGLCEGRGWPMQLVPDDGFCDKGERREKEND